MQIKTKKELVDFLIRHGTGITDRTGVEVDRVESQIKVRLLGNAEECTFFCRSSIHAYGISISRRCNCDLNDLTSSCA